MNIIQNPVQHKDINRVSNFNVFQHTECNEKRF
uniref:Uncharacterized protein n=1 Tax=Rhizophora mucronata TaxID=61149 RepID=A0A2P2MXR9_RHIMU